MTHDLSRLLAWLIVAAAVAAGALTLGRPLANPDEGRYAEISQRMAASGDWVTPRLNGVKYLEKPPLQYWAGALALKAFPAEEAAARLYVALCGLLTLLMVGYTAFRLGTRETGIAALAALASSPYFMAMTGIVTLDTGLTWWTTLAFCAYLLAENPAAMPAARRRWMLAAWAATALAVLSKGPVGALFPAAALGLHCLVRRDFTPLARLEWRLGLALFTALVAPWFVAVSLANPEFPEFFFIHEHVQRFLTASHRRTEPWWFFLPIVALGFLPWMFALPAALAHGWSHGLPVRGVAPTRLAILWSAFVVVFFSLSSSKLPAYVLPAVPPLALVLGRYLAQAPTRVLAWQSAGAALLGVALVVAAWRMPLAAREPWTRLLYGEAMPWAVGAATALAGGSALAAALLWRERRWPALAVTSVATAAAMVCFAGVFNALAPRQSGLEAAERLRPYVTAATRLYSVRYFEHSVPFYLGRPLTLVEYLDEFEPGLKAEPSLHIPDLDAFKIDWMRPGNALAIMNPAAYVRLRSRAVPMHVLHEDPRRILVRKP